MLEPVSIRYGYSAAGKPNPALTLELFQAARHHFACRAKLDRQFLMRYPVFALLMEIQQCIGQSGIDRYERKLFDFCDEFRVIGGVTVKNVATKAGGILKGSVEGLTGYCYGLAVRFGNRVCRICTATQKARCRQATVVSGSQAAERDLPPSRRTELNADGSSQQHHERVAGTADAIDHLPRFQAFDSRILEEHFQGWIIICREARKQSS